MIKAAFDRLVGRVSPPTGPQNDYMDFDSNLDVLRSSCANDVVSQAVCATAMLRRAATWCRRLGADRDMVVDFVRYALDDGGDCDISQAEKIWQSLEIKNNIRQEKKHEHG